MRPPKTRVKVYHQHYLHQQYGLHHPTVTEPQTPDSGWNRGIPLNSQTGETKTNSYLPSFPLTGPIFEYDFTGSRHSNLKPLVSPVPHPCFSYVSDSLPQRRRCGNLKQKTLHV